MTVGEINVYFDDLVRRSPFAKVVRCLPFEDAECSKCHANAEKFVAKYGGKVVRGWLVTMPGRAPALFEAHSVVRRHLYPWARLFDVTLSEEKRGRRGFLRHRGSEEQFDFLSVNFAQMNEVQRQLSGR